MFQLHHRIKIIYSTSTYGSKDRYWFGLSRADHWESAHYGAIGTSSSELANPDDEQTRVAVTT